MLGGELILDFLEVRGYLLGLPRGPLNDAEAADLMDITYCFICPCITSQF